MNPEPGKITERISALVLGGDNKGLVSCGIYCSLLSLECNQCHLSRFAIIL
jgi:hypothetical protein